MSSFEAIHREVVQNHRKGTTLPYAFRLKQLQRLKEFLIKEEKVLAEALRKDLHRADFESRGLEIVCTIAEVDFAIGNLKKWMEPEVTAVPALFSPAKSEIHAQPYGTCLIIGPFNYPITLTICPLIGAVAAGNSAIIKPSELTPACEKVLSEILPRYLDSNHYRVVTGDYRANQALLNLRWDKIFFTGSTMVGKIILEAAAKHLTPVSLELGGKSPTVVDKAVGDLELAAQRIAWGKSVNCGQTCIAPDYVYVHESIHDQFIVLLKQKFEQFYGKNPQDHKDYGRIVNDRHFQRVKTLLDDSKDLVYSGGRSDASDKYIEPTIILNPSKTSKIMSEEIFGPLLPVFKYSKIEEVIDHVNEGEKPLTLYIFSHNESLIQRLLNEISSGSVLVNDTIYQFGNFHAPFGGIGHSGMGGYRGKFSFECFSQKRPVLRRDAHRILDPPIRYPPYTDLGLTVFKTGVKLPDIPPFSWKPLLKFGFVGLAVFAAYSANKKGILPFQDLYDHFYSSLRGFISSFRV